MAFLTPLFLAALAVLGAPVLLHMIQRQRTEVVEFPSLMFVRKIPFHSLRRQRIRHWLLLLLRCAAVALLIAAFARPFLRSTALAVAGGGREVVILLDRSWSMAYGDRWDRARAAARGVVRDLGPDDRATVVLFDSGAQSGTRSTNDRASLLAAIDGAGVGAGTTRFGPALQLAQGILEDSDQPQLDVVFISDLQQTGIDSAANTLLPPGTVLTPVAVATEAETPNVSVVGVSVQRDTFAGAERATVTARLANRGSRPVEQMRVALELNDYELEALAAAAGAESVASVTFAPFTVEDTAMPVSVRAQADALPHDDVFHFLVSPGDVVSVLVVGSSGAPEASLYLERALAIGESPSFAPVVRSVDELTVEDIEAASVVVLNDVGLPSGPLGTAITRSVRDGVGLWIVLGERARWPGGNFEVLPGAIDEPADRDGRGGVLGFVDYSHPVFELFGTPRSGDLTTPRFFRYRPIDLQADAAVLARYDNGAVALAERRIGGGRVLVWTSTLDSFWNDVALKPIYLPLVHKTVEYLAAYRPPTPYLTAGQVLDLAQYPGADGLDLAGGNLVVRNPSDDRVPIGSGGRDGRSGFVDLVEPGFYEIRDVDAADVSVIRVAVNVDPAESNLARADSQELVAAVTGRAGGDRSVAAQRELPPEDLERRQTLWWYLMIGALGFLAAETVVSNRLSRRALDPDA